MDPMLHDEGRHNSVDALSVGTAQASTDNIQASGGGGGVRSQNQCFTMWGLPQITNPSSQLLIQAPDYLSKPPNSLSKVPKS